MSLASTFRRPTGTLSRYPHLWLARDGGLDCRSGQTFDLVRAAAATSTDSFGTASNAQQDEPRIETVDTNADTVRDRTGLLLGSGDLCAHDFAAHLQAASGLLQFQERGTVGTANAGLFSWSNDTPSGVQIYIYSGGGVYTIAYHDGTTGVSSAMGVAPATNDLVELYWKIQSDGKVQLSQSINAGAFVSSTLSGALTLAGKAFPASTKLRWNSRGVVNPGSVLAFGSVVAMGNQAVTDLQAVLR